MSIFGKYRSGKGSRITANTVNLGLAEFSVDYKGDDLDTTNFESGGFDQGTIGIIGCDADCRGLWNANKNAFDSPPGLFPQDSFPNLLLFENVTDNVGWTFPLFRILSAKNGAQVRQTVTFEFSGKSNGTFTVPTGSV